jgi:hypothetical protein
MFCVQLAVVAHFARVKSKKRVLTSSAGLFFSRASLEALFLCLICGASKIFP